MELKNYYAQDAQGNIMPGADCHLYLAGTETLAEDLEDASGKPMGNPFKASHDGLVQFAAPNGRYDLQVAKGGHLQRIRIQCNDVDGNVQIKDLANPDMGAAMVARGVVALDQVSELVAQHPAYRRTDLRYVVSNQADGMFAWNSEAPRSLHDGVRFFSPTVPWVDSQTGGDADARAQDYMQGAGETEPGATGVFERVFSGPIRSTWFLLGRSAVSATYLQDAWDYVVNSSLDLNMDHVGVHSPTGPLVFGDLSKPYSGTVTGALDVGVSGGILDSEDVVAFLAVRGVFDAVMYIRANGHGRDVVRFRSCQNLCFKRRFHARSARRWNISYDVSGNSNGIRFEEEKRATLGGSTGTSEFAFVEHTDTISSRLSGVVVPPGEPLDYVIRVGGHYYGVSNYDPDSQTLIVYPRLRDTEATSLIYWFGGGICYRGADGGTGVINRNVVQDNRGVGVRHGSLYGPSVASFTAELNSGPSIAAGTSYTSNTLKMTYSDAYFEGGPTERIVLLTSNPEMTILNAYNLGLDGLYYVGKGLAYRVEIPQPDVAFAEPAAFVGITARTALRGRKYLWRSSTAVSSEFVVTLRDVTYSDGAVEIDMVNFDRPVRFIDNAGGLVNGEEALVVTSPGSVHVTAYRDGEQWLIVTQPIVMPS